MYLPRVKICGIKTQEIAESAVENGADSLGFVFFSKSPRAVEASLVRAITSQMPPFVNKTGVFVDKDMKEILNTAEMCGIDTIQLHGETKLYSGEFIELLSEKCRLPIILALRMAIIDERSIAKLMNNHCLGISAWIIDRKETEKFGGTGKAAIWEKISDKATAAFLRSRIIIAGGINASNIDHLLEKMLPYGIDVSSGLERERGVKDKKLIIEFMRHLREISARY